MVLAFWGDLRTEEELRALLATRGGGTKFGHLADLAPLGVEVTFYETGIPFLELCLETGVPPVVPLATGFLGYWDEECDHAAVVVGVDDAAVTLNDPAFPDAPRVVPVADFLRVREENDCICAVIVPPMAAEDE